MGKRVLAFVVCAAWPAFAAAQPDNRPGDRFFFGIQGGPASGSDETFVQPDFGSAGPSIGYETSYWPNDYLGFGLNLQLIAVPESDGRPRRTNIDMGLPLLVGVPLRYVQPYVGGWLGLTHTFVERQGQGVRAAVSPVAGVNAYINRNVRFFVQYQSVSFEEGAEAHAQLVVAGARFSPDAFHQLRPAMKFQALWWSALGTVAAWVLVGMALGDEPEGEG